MHENYPLVCASICRFLVPWNIPRLGIVQVSQSPRCFLLARSQQELNYHTCTIFGKDLRLTTYSTPLTTLKSCEICTQRLHKVVEIEAFSPGAEKAFFKRRVSGGSASLYAKSLSTQRSFSTPKACIIKAQTGVAARRKLKAQHPQTTKAG